MIDFRTLLLAFLFAGIFGVAYLTPAYSQEVEKGPNYDRMFIGYASDDKAIYSWTSVPDRIIDSYDWNGNPIYKDYRLYQDVNYIIVETANAGSFAFNKNTCSYNLHRAGYMDINPMIKNISWSVKGKHSSSSVWSAVNSVNNAACSTTLQTTESTVKIIGEKSASSGKFQIVLDYVPGHGIKETMRAYNNNPAWTSHNIGFSETFELPKIITFAEQHHDLSQLNGTVLSRTWINNNQAKIMQFTENIFYDFGIGFDNLDTVEISYIDGQARLTMNYLFTNMIVPYQEWFEVDPTFGYSTGTKKVSQDASAIQATCTQSTIANSTHLVTTQLGNSANNELCRLGSFQWNTASIPDGVGVLSTQIRFDVVGTTSNSDGCDYVSMETKPSTATQQQHWDDIAGNDGTTTVYVDNDTKCNTVANDYTLLLGSAANTDVEDLLSQNWFAVGTRQDNFPNRDATLRQSNLDTVELQVNYTTALKPDAVDDLTATQITTVQVMLDWTEPGLNGGTLLQYMVNYTTPIGTPTTVLAYTGSTDTEYTATLPSSCPCSFRVSAVTEAGSNSTGNITDIEGVSFEIGNINVTATNTEQAGIQFELDPINGTADWLNVTYADTYDLACDFGYMFARTNNTYTNLDNTTVNDSFVESSFLILDHDNEIINVRCWDQNTNDTGFYVLTQSNFPLLDQIQNFRNGTYGTAGNFGLLDFITLIVVIISMIGFNRVDETVGAIFNVFFLGVLWYFEIIEPISLLFGFLAVAIMLIITKNRGD